jgi:VanZ family protein
MTPPIFPRMLAPTARCGARGRRWPLAPALLLIISATLLPAGGLAEPEPRACFACGDGITGDALLNVLLFVPFGAALAAAGFGAVATTAAGLLLSAAVETAQLWIPGRFSTLSDLLANTAGAAAGWLLVRHGRAAVHTRRRRRALGTAAVLLPIASAAATAALLAPAIRVGEPPVGRWTPEWPGRPPYDGRLVDVRVGDVFIPPAPIPAARRSTALFLAGEALVVSAEAGGPSRQRLPIFDMVADGDVLLLLASDGPDAVFRFRTRAAALGFDHPELRYRGALRDVSPGAPLRIEVRRGAPRWCIAVNSVERCDFAYSVADGWALLKYRGGMPPAIERAIGWLWLAGLAFPAGLLVLPGARVLRGSVILAAVAGLSALAPGLAYSTAALVPLAGGFVLGATARISLLQRYRCVARKHQETAVEPARESTK